jgi:hypothetical protein
MRPIRCPRSVAPVTGVLAIFYWDLLIMPFDGNGPTDVNNNIG